MMANQNPELLFGWGTSSGFTPAGIAAFDDLHPAAVVRELIQNSLDAARLANVRPAKVQFKVTRASRGDVPGMKSFEETFRKAVRTQRNRTGSQARQVIRRIGDALKQSEMDVLSVLDNGVGLDEQRMNALLSDGVSYKKDDATGTYGNGHSTAIPASDLRYVLYGGLTKGGSRICSGHAVLASHVEEGEKHLRSGDGFLITEFKAGRDTLFDYAIDACVPKFIASDLDKIEAEFGHGTTVIIPAFNNLMEDDSLWDMVSHSASANFFSAIADGDLEVGVEINRGMPGDNVWELNKENLEEQLIHHSDKKLASKFMNGSLAYDAYRTYVLQDPGTVKNRLGNADVRIREVPTGNTRVHLCRNGMWITDKIPIFAQKFADRVPFNAIVSLNAADGGDLHRLVRDAEGPLHNSILLKRLRSEQQSQCRKALRRIVDWILKNTTEVTSEAYSPNDFLVLDSGSHFGGDGSLRPAFSGTPMIVKRYPALQLQDSSGPSEESGLEPSNLSNEGTGRNPPNRSRERRRPTLPPFIQAVSRPIDKNRRKIFVECSKSVADAELRLVVDEALDATCDRPGQDIYTPATLSDVQINGQLVDERFLNRVDDKAVGVLLGDLSANGTIEIETNYELQGDFANLSSPSLRVEIFKRQRDGDT